jgi:hypothetical protein
MARLEIEDLLQGLDERIWMKRFADPYSGLLPGRYRCEKCVSEWWQFPVKLASGTNHEFRMHTPSV